MFFKKGYKQLIYFWLAAGVGVMTGASAPAGRFEVKLGDNTGLDLSCLYPAAIRAHQVEQKKAKAKFLAQVKQNELVLPLVPFDLDNVRSRLIIDLSQAGFFTNSPVRSEFQPIGFGKRRAVSKKFKFA